jgi:hypothetical protein
VKPQLIIFIRSTEKELWMQEKVDVGAVVLIEFV